MEGTWLLYFQYYDVAVMRKESSEFEKVVGRYGQ